MKTGAPTFEPTGGAGIDGEFVADVVRAVDAGDQVEASCLMPGYFYLRPFIEALTHIGVHFVVPIVAEPT